MQCCFPLEHDSYILNFKKKSKYPSKYQTTTKVYVITAVMTAVIKTSLPSFSHQSSSSVYRKQDWRCSCLRDELPHKWKCGVSMWLYCYRKTFPLLIHLEEIHSHAKKNCLPASMSKYICNF